MEESDEVRVKNEPIWDRQSNKVKEEPIDIEVKAEEKFSSTEEFANKASIAFLNEETTQETTKNTYQS